MSTTQTSSRYDVSEFRAHDINIALLKECRLVCAPGYKHDTPSG